MAQREKLTEKLVRAVEPRAGIYQVFDEDVRGFSLRIFSSGSRHFALDYRVKGRQRRFTIGRWPEWTVTAAREQAKSRRRANKPRHCAASLTMAVTRWASGKPGWRPPASPI
ncbi:Arm DNA-binding domain-containing protein [Paracoccus albicereus]|uniref:Arm DNA-binding domain-containing protein n=1 Tax=Paracoccus albicereus TaxID=2922394 RepID=UPI00210090A6|nr:Arm DNA-binding domain-containing protein [Paracoccus albicereus]